VNHVVPLFYGKLRKIPVLRSGPRVHLRREEFEPRRRGAEILAVILWATLGLQSDLEKKIFR